MKRDMSVDAAFDLMYEFLYDEVFKPTIDSTQFSYIIYDNLPLGNPEYFVEVYEALEDFGVDFTVDEKWDMYRHNSNKFNSFILDLGLDLERFFSGNVVNNIVDFTLESLRYHLEETVKYHIDKTRESVVDIFHPSIQDVIYEFVNDEPQEGLIYVYYRLVYGGLIRNEYNKLYAIVESYSKEDLAYMLDFSNKDKDIYIYPEELESILEEVIYSKDEEE